MEAMNNAIKSYNQGMGKMSSTASIASRQRQEPSVKSIGNSSNAYQQYQNNMVNTAAPQDLTLMLYNGLVRFLKLAHQGIEENDFEKSNNNLLRSQDIISEFMCTLDMKYEISKSLMTLYEYMNNRLIEANLKKDNSIVEEVIGYAEELRDTWAQAMKLAKQSTASEL